MPLIISWPGVIEGGRVSDALVELVDLAPTICEAAGIEPEEGNAGKIPVADAHGQRAAVLSSGYGLQ